MILTLFNAFKVKELRNRLLFVLGAFTVFVFGLHVSVPGIDRAQMERIFSQGGLLGLLDVFTGGALKKFSIFAMGITPYINASIIMSLMNVVIPKLEDLQKKEGEHGRRVIARYTRYLTIALALVQGIGLTVWLKNLGVFAHVTPILYVRTILTLVGGTAFLMWLGEQISDRGIGNGVSLLIFCGIVARMPNDAAQTIELYRAGIVGMLNVLIFFAIAAAVVAGIVFIQQSERRIQVQYTKRIVGRKMYGGGSTFLPLKLNHAGVIPIIFAISVLLFFPTMAQFFPDPRFQAWANGFSGTIYYNIILALLVIFFTYFYTAVTFNPNDVADNMKKYGGFVPGIRPGKPTAEYIDKIITRITLVGALFLAAIAVLPSYVMQTTNITSFYLGGTSILIVVGVALDTVSQLEAQMLMRHYEGFLK